MAPLPWKEIKSVRLCGFEVALPSNDLAVIVSQHDVKALPITNTPVFVDVVCVNQAFHFEFPTLMEAQLFVRIEFFDGVDHAERHDRSVERYRIATTPYLKRSYALTSAYHANRMILRPNTVEDRLKWEDNFQVAMERARVLLDEPESDSVFDS